MRQSTLKKWRRWHLDPILLGTLILLTFFGLFVLYSAANQSLSIIFRQCLHLVAAFIVMFICARIPPSRYQEWAPWFYLVTVFLLLLVLVVGQVDMGARRWLHLGFFDLQPSELMKIGMPLMLAYYFHDKALPPNLKTLAVGFIILLIPVLLVAKEPDLGTAIMIATSGLLVLFLAGMGWRLILSFAVLAAAFAPVLWHFMHTYQKERVLTFLNPERDPLGSGYHIIQSKIAIGSGGFFGKGWLQGTQSHLHFLPAHTTDFIFAVNGEELGLLGCLFLILLFLGILARCLFVSAQAHDTFTRLLAGSLSFTFIISAFINIGMVTGILPVVGIPLPLISYGGSYIVTLMAGFGIIMSIYTHKKLWTT